MAIEFALVKAGDILWDAHKQRAGNTRMTRLGNWRVDVLEVTAAGAWVSWNGNPRVFWSAFRIGRLRRTPKQGEKI